MFATGALGLYILVTSRIVTRIIGNLPAMTMSDSADPRRYMQLAAVLRAQIADGTYARDARVPSIRALCEEHQLSRQKWSYLRPYEGTRCGSHPDPAQPDQARPPGDSPRCLHRGP